MTDSIVTVARRLHESNSELISRAVRGQNFTYNEVKVLVKNLEQDDKLIKKAENS